MSHKTVPGIGGTGQPPSLAELLETHGARACDPEPTWKPNHDPRSDVTGMIIINDTTMTSEQNPHTARHAPEWNGWELSWLPGHILGRNTATTLTGTVAERHLHHGHRLWPRIQGWAAEVGLPVPGAITRASGPPEKISTQEHATSRADPDPDPEAGL